MTRKASPIVSAIWLAAVCAVFLVTTWLLAALVGVDAWLVTPLSGLLWLGVARAVAAFHHHRRQRRAAQRDTG